VWSFFVPLSVASLGGVSQEMIRKIGSKCSPKVGGASPVQEKMLFLATVFGLDIFLTLDNENKLSLFSLNRNFALSLWFQSMESLTEL
jgi:hypothetical protein